MTKNRFNQVKANFSEFEGKEVEFKYYIPSAYKYAKAKGILRKVGTGCNENCLIINERGKEKAIYFENVKFINEEPIEVVKEEIERRIRMREENPDNFIDAVSTSWVLKDLLEFIDTIK